MLHLKIAEKVVKDVCYEKEVFKIFLIFSSSTTNLTLA